jgi:hypothetical protein
VVCLRWPVYGVVCTIGRGLALGGGNLVDVGDIKARKNFLDLSVSLITLVILFFLLLVCSFQAG